MDALLNTLKFARKMFADIIKFVVISSELVRKVWNLWYYRSLQ